MSTTSNQPPGGWVRPRRSLPMPGMLQLRTSQPCLLVDHPLDGALIATFGERSRATIGRAPWCELVVDWDPAVSRTQAVVEAFGPVLTIEPPVSATNPTRVDGVDVRQRTPLADGQVITIGQTSLHVRLPAGAELSETVRVEDAPAQPPAALSRAERRLAIALARRPHATNRELSEELGLAHETVRTQLQTLLRKARSTAIDPAAVDRTTVIAELTRSGRFDVDAAEPPAGPGINSPT